MSDDFMTNGIPVDDDVEIDDEDTLFDQDDEVVEDDEDAFLDDGDEAEEDE